MARWKIFASVFLLLCVIVAISYNYSTIINFYTSYPRFLSSADVTISAGNVSVAVWRRPGERNQLAMLHRGAVSVVMGANRSRTAANRSHTAAEPLFRTNHTLFAAISASTPAADNQYNYVFDLPLTVLAWQRIGYSVIVTIAGSEAEWAGHEVLKLVLEHVYSFGVTVLFINCPLDNRVMVSQVSRVLVASLLQDSLKPTDYIVLSDADLWPLDRDKFTPNRDYDITSLNAECCGYFEHLGNNYKMLPMAHVGATVAVWLDMIQTNRFLPRDGEGILKYFEAEFGPVAREPVQKGENLGWYQDQRMLSVLVAEWTQRNNRSRVNLVARNVGEDRIDKAWWDVQSLAGKTDAHILDQVYQYGSWFRLTPLLRLMYGEDSPPFRFCMDYYEAFTLALRRHRNLGSGQ